MKKEVTIIGAGLVGSLLSIFLSEEDTRFVFMRKETICERKE